MGIRTLIVDDEPIARQILRERKTDEAYQDWLRQMRDRAYVDIRLDER